MGDLEQRKSTMGELQHRITSGIIPGLGTPENTVSIKVSRKALRAVIDDGLKKSTWVERHIPIRLRNRVTVEASEFGTSDSVFFVPEHANVNFSNQRVAPVEYIKVNAGDQSDLVRRDESFDVSFVGMSVSPQDYAGNNELLLCSLTKEDFVNLESKKQNTIVSATSDSTVSEDTAVDDKTQDSDDSIKKAKKVSYAVQADDRDLEDLPTSVTVHPGDYPFVHFDPEIDGHNVGHQPDTFVPVPGSKRLYLQRKPETNEKYGDVNMRFTIMEVDKLSEEQLIAIKSLEDIGKSVGKAAASVPYLKVISWMLKFANFLGSSALKKVAQPDHVLSKDISFMIAPPQDEREDSKSRREQIGNYLRYGYYFFLSSTVDAKLYAQIGASSQNVQLLLKRQGYRAKLALPNEVEYFPLAGVSYVVMKVTRGCAPVSEERPAMLLRHRKRLVKLLKKYTGSLAVTHDDPKKVPSLAKELVETPVPEGKGKE